MTGIVLPPRGVPVGKPVTLKQLEGIWAFVNADDANKRDVVLTANQLEFTDRKTLALPSSTGTKEYGFSDHGFDGLATLLDIPSKYLSKCPVTGRGGMKDQIEMRLESNDTRSFLVRIRETEEDNKVHGTIRAVLPGTHVAFDNRHLLQAVERALKGGEGTHWTIMGSNITSPKEVERELNLRLVRKAMFQPLQGLDIDDPHQSGFHARTSEIGLGNISVQSLVYRLLCTNGLMGMDSRGETFRSRFDKMPHEANPLIQEAIMASTRQEEAVADIFQRAYAEEVAEPTTSIFMLGRQKRLPEPLIERAVELFANENQPHNRYGMLQAYTSAAKEYPLAERAKLEETIGAAFFQGSGGRSRRRHAEPATV